MGYKPISPRVYVSMGSQLNFTKYNESRTVYVQYASNPHLALPRKRSIPEKAIIKTREQRD